jgi:hypothetical protein
MRVLASWRVPQSYLDKYPPESIGLAAHPIAPPGMPQIAYHDTARSPGEHQQWEGWGYRGADSNPSDFSRHTPKVSRQDTRNMKHDRAFRLDFQLQGPGHR